MTAYEDMDEELRRIYDEGSASAMPAELAELRAQIPPEPMGEELPKGTKVVFAEQDLPVAAHPPSRTPITPKVIDLTNEPMDDMEMAAARLEDRQARSREALERGTRQLIGGLTRTEALPSTPGPTDAVAQLLAKRREREAQRQHENQQRLGAAKVDFDRQEAARKAALHEQERGEDKKTAAENEAWRREEATRDNERSERGIDATRELARSNYALRRDEAAAKKEERDEKRGATIPVMGGTLTPAPGLGDSERSKAREVAGLWNAADESVANFQAALEDFARNPSIESKGRVTAALRTASSAFNSAIGGGAMSQDEALAMSQALGADLLTPTGIQALAQSVFGDDGKAAATISNRVRAARQANRAAALGRLKTYGTFSEGGASAPMAAAERPIVKNPKTGERRFLNPDGSLGEVVQ